MAAPRSMTRTEVAARVAAVREATDLEARREAAEALEDTALDSANTTFLMDAGVVSVVETVLREWDDAEAKVGCIEAIIFMAIGANDDTKLALADVSLLESIVAFMSQPHDDDPEVAATALCCLAERNSEVTQRIRDVPGVIEALEVLKEGLDVSGKLFLDHLRTLSPSG